jgi:hypothetical protein
MKHKTRRTLAVLGAILIGVFAAASVRAQAGPETRSGASPGDPTDGAHDAQPPTPPAPAAAVAPATLAPSSVPPPAWADPSQTRGRATLSGPRRAEYDGPPLLLGRRIAVGGYGGVSAAYTRMLDRHGTMLGLEGALLIDHRLSLGLAGHGFSRTPAGPADADGAPREFAAGYGGFVGRYAFFTRSPVYASVGLLVGGGVVVLQRDWDGERSHYDNPDRDEAEADGFFVVQPELSLHANLTRWMRLGLACGYRVTSGVQRLGLSESDLNGPVVGGNVQFGWI